MNRLSGKAFYKTLIDNLYDGVYFVDAERRITYWNRSAEQITGFMAADILGRHCWDNILRHVDDKGTNLCLGLCPLVIAMREVNLQEREVYLHHKAGHRVPVLVRTSPILDKRGKVVGAVEIFSDNTPKITLMQRVDSLEKQALLDPLTTLGNRRFAETQLAAKLDEMRRYGWPFGVFFIDIDHFKKINDTYGHEVGDRVLKMVGLTLQNGVRSFDVVCRWGGEEFIAIVAGIDADELCLLANRLRILVGQSSLSEGEETIRVTVSVGVAIVRPDDTEQSLIERADRLMYRCKSEGRDRVTTEPCGRRAD